MQVNTLALVLSAGAVVCAALIAAYVAAVGHNVSKINAEIQSKTSIATARLNASLTADLKLAEMRQSWINALRIDMADFISMALNPGQRAIPEGKYYLLGSRIKLLMNPKDQDYKALVARLDLLMTKTEREAPVIDTDSAYIEVCQSILKREWDRLKADIDHFSSRKPPPAPSEGKGSSDTSRGPFIKQPALPLYIS